jgi:hypothetical protein
VPRWLAQTPRNQTIEIAHRAATQLSVACQRWQVAGQWYRSEAVEFELDPHRPVLARVLSSRAVPQQQPPDDGMPCGCNRSCLK